LVELMIVVAILGIIFTVVPKILLNIHRFSSMNKARLETQKYARETLSQVNKSLRQAHATSIVISKENNQPPCSSLSFQTVDDRHMKYYQSGTDLKFATAGGTRTIAENLKYIAFTLPRSDDDNIISVSVTFEKNTYEGGSKALQMAIEKVRIMND